MTEELRQQIEQNTVVNIIVEKHPDGYVAHSLGLKGVVVGEGDTYEDALGDIKSAIRFHLDTFGNEDLQDEFVDHENH